MTRSLRAPDVVWLDQDTAKLYDDQEFSNETEYLLATPKRKAADELYELLADVIDAFDDKGLASNDWEFALEAAINDARLALTRASGEQS